MPTRKTKLERIHHNTLKRLETKRTHRRQTVDDLINFALDRLEIYETPVTYHKDDNGKFIKRD